MRRTSPHGFVWDYNEEGRPKAGLLYFFFFVTRWRAQPRLIIQREVKRENPKPSRMAQKAKETMVMVELLVAPAMSPM